MPDNTVKASIYWNDDRNNNLSYNNLLPGDIILFSNPDSFFDHLVPGKFQHVEIFCGFVKPGELIWDRTNHHWMPIGTPYVIHSTCNRVSGNGLGYDTWRIAVNAHTEDAVALRVMKPNGESLSSLDRYHIISFLKDQLAGGWDGFPVGPGYDPLWFTKSVDVNDHGYYCSEFAWAAYYSVLGIDLDSDTTPLNAGVSPDDLRRSQYTSVIAGEIGSSRWSASSDLYKLTVHLYRIYYRTDYDDGRLGAGEMYVTSKIGDQQFPTEEGYPGCGKIGRTPDGTWSKNGRGNLYWNKNFYSVLNYQRPIQIRLQAWEKDRGDDDAYQYSLLTYGPSIWHSFIGNGWSSMLRIVKSDCVYYFRFRIDIINVDTGGGGGGSGSGNYFN